MNVVLLEGHDKVWQQFTRDRIDVMLCDIDMPRGSGLDLLTWVRENKYTTECIFLTCHANFDYAASAIRLDSTDYLLKPVSAQQLETAVGRAVQRLGRISLVEDLPSGESASGTRALIPSIRKYIVEHLAEDLDRDSIAAAVHLSPDYLSHIFREKTGESLSAYILNLRIEKAMRLLSMSSASIADIASECGFNNISYFSRQFKACTGKTPHEFQKNG
ncbi:response regulator transcription factor [Lachnoclostridium sp. Marseille-P6806]|uniref:response regulator transcription factor n=1 Tax=Lachnoclostridium sp. Marseille-P6806 TaxID=2364793 RepID=UPI00102FE83A|nr:helix-turn-helix domain-containing protein [Lachnoclostridium sp. Marseille-P6806]